MYHVSTQYPSLKDHAGLFTYAGTPPERAQETLAVTAGELRRLAEGVEDEEMARARTQLKSAIIMQGESTGARAGAIAADQYVFGRPRTLDDVEAEIDAITIDRLNEFVAAHKPERMTVVTVGPDELKVV